MNHFYIDIGYNDPTLIYKIELVKTDKLPAGTPLIEIIKTLRSKNINNVVVDSSGPREADMMRYYGLTVQRATLSTDTPRGDSARKETTPSDDEGLFDNAFGEWLEAHGVELSPMLVGNKFVAHVDLNELKPAIMALISQKIRDTAKAYGGCTKCYGKGYATYKGEYKARGVRWDDEAIRYCDCPRGNQLEAIVGQKVTAARVAELSGVKSCFNDLQNAEEAAYIESNYIDPCIATLTTKQDTKEK
jgi:hypothetical protein